MIMPSAELDAKLATSVMGWVARIALDECYVTDPSPHGRRDERWSPSTVVAHAIEMLLRHPDSYQIISTRPLGVRATLMNPSVSKSARLSETNGDRETAFCLAICRAFATWAITAAEAAGGTDV